MQTGDQSQQEQDAQAAREARFERALAWFCILNFSALVATAAWLLALCFKR